MSGLEDDPKPDGRPMYDMMVSWQAVAAFVTEHGGAEFERRLHDEVREAMDDLGVRVVLWYGERMDNISAQMEEWTS
jgi:hypothetical protein